MHDWRSAKLTEDYLEGVRGGIPLAETQIEVIIRIIKSWVPGLHTFLDMGCGDGVLGRQLLEEWPDSEGIFMDFSEPMISSAKEKCEIYKNRCSIIYYYGCHKLAPNNVNTAAMKNPPVPLYKGGT